MSQFLERLTYLSRRRVRWWPGRRGRHREDGYRAPLAARQGGSQHARRELHGRMHLADLREERHRHLGDAAVRLSAPAARHSHP